MSETVQISRELAENALDYLVQLRGERSWWKDEPRCNYQIQYAQLCLDIRDMEAAIKRPGKPL